VKCEWKELEGGGWTAEEAKAMDAAMKRGWAEQRGDQTKVKWGCQR